MMVTHSKQIAQIEKQSGWMALLLGIVISLVLMIAVPGINWIIVCLVLVGCLALRDLIWIPLLASWSILPFTQSLALAAGASLLLAAAGLSVAQPLLLYRSWFLPCYTLILAGFMLVRRRVVEAGIERRELEISG
ncbi:MAG: hypothetical protein NTU59_06520 [Coprothermobacterota bacterium]|nr:hypothetical protein [Coprothermobacterota bacterium]